MAYVVDKQDLMTVDDFYAWDGGGHQGKLELVDGVVRAMAPANVEHGMIQGNLAGILYNHLRKAGNRRRFATEAGVIPRMDSKHNVRVPDLTVTCEPNTLNEKAILSPVLVVEIISPSNKKEIGESILAVATIPSVREVVTFESETMQAVIFRRDENRNWPREGITVEPGGEVESAEFDLAFPLEGAYRGTHFLQSGEQTS